MYEIETRIINGSSQSIRSDVMLNRVENDSDTCQVDTIKTSTAVAELDF